MRVAGPVTVRRVTTGTCVAMTVTVIGVAVRSLPTVADTWTSPRATPVTLPSGLTVATAGLSPWNTAPGTRPGSRVMPDVVVPVRKIDASNPWPGPMGSEAGTANSMAAVRSDGQMDGTVVPVHSAA